MSARIRHKLLKGLLGVAAALAAGQASAGWGELNMPVGVTELSREVYDLHTLILWICVVIGVVVFGVMIYSIVKFRKSKGAKAAQFHENTAVEIIWTIIPFLILVGMAIPATKTLIKMEDASNPDLTVKVTGYQWKWRYEYLNDNNEVTADFFSTLSTPRSQVRGEQAKSENYLLEVDNPLVVPVGQKIRFLFTAGDVIHAWWLPDLGWKKDAIPGVMNRMWARIDEPGTYRGKCAELCGKDHGFMPIVVKALPQDEYKEWYAQHSTASAGAVKTAAAAGGDGGLGKDELIAQGKTVYQKHCQSCHQANGEGIPGTFPALKGGQIATGDVAKHIDVVVNGVKGTAMQAFGPQLSDAELAAVVTYERNAWGNDTGDVVKPADIKAAR